MIALETDKTSELTDIDFLTQIHRRERVEPPVLLERHASIRVGIDVGFSMVKSVILGVAGKKLTPVWVRASQRPANRQWAEILADEIEAIRRKLSPKRVQVVLGLESELANVRYVRFPNVPEAEFDKAARIEASTHLFLPKDDLRVEVSLYPPRQKDNAAGSHGIVCAASAGQIQDRLRTLKQIGTRDGKVVLTSVAVVAGCLQSGITSGDRVHVLIDIGARSGKIIIHRGAEIYLARDFLTGLQENAPAGNGAAAGSPKGAAGEEDGHLFFAELSVDTISNEIMMSLSFFAREYGYNIDHATLIGGEAALDGLFAALNEKLKVPLVELAKQPPAIMAGEGECNELLRRHLSIIFPAWSLASIDPAKLQVGHFTLKEKHFKAMRRTAVRWELVAAFVLLIGGAVFFATGKLRSLASALEQSQATMLTDNARMSETIDAWQARPGASPGQEGAALGAFADQPTAWLEFMQFVATKCPREVWLTKITVRQAKMDERQQQADPTAAMSPPQLISLEGFASTPAGPDRFVQSFMQMHLFDKQTMERLIITQPDSGEQHVAFELDLRGE